jgi:hypothetical protein
MKNYLLIFFISFIFVACTKEQPTKNDLLIKKLEAKNHLDEMDKLELEEARAFSKEMQNNLHIKDAFNTCKTR